MIKPSLDNINSFINGNASAKDTERAFTYFEFVKEWGFGENVDDFIVEYKEYLIRWNNNKKGEYSLTSKQFVEEKLIDTLKSITLDYSSYEEQDFIANLDWKNPNHLRAVLPLYCRKIKEVTEFYRNKRNEAHLTVQRNSLKGSTKSIEEIIYQKVFDYIFSNRNVQVSYADIKRDLLISVENYIDTYSEYFDIPRYSTPNDTTRAKILSANMNDVSWKDYLQIKTVISETLYSGNVFLKEIPLIAQLGLDLTQKCVGDMLVLRNTLVQNTTINLIPLTEQVALRRRLYEKFLGCDLYYMYTDLNGNVVQSDILCYAKNPTGNLLNCGNPDQAVNQSEQLQLLTHVGLFFKPDKTSILKVNAKNYTFEVDKENLQPDTVYIFPDPSKYGDIGNNKTSDYPFIMRYKLDYDIKNMSSGAACNDPLLLVTDQGWRGYFSKQDEDFRYITNENFEYSFTSLANMGIIQQYQVDAYGNQFGLLKGCEVEYYNEEGERVESPEAAYKTIYIYGEGTIDLPSYPQTVDTEVKPILLNGGYFEDPYNPGKPFDYERKIRINKTYNWSGLILPEKPLALPSTLYNQIKMGEFGQANDVVYQDHFNVINKDVDDKTKDSSYSDSLIKPFLSVKAYGNPDTKYEIKTKRYTREELKTASGELWIRLSGSLQNKPVKLQEVAPECDGEGIISFQIIHETIILEYKDRWSIVPYTFNGKKIIANKEIFTVQKSDYNGITFVESNKTFYFAIISKDFDSDALSAQFIINIYSYNCKNRVLKHNIKDYEGDDFIQPYSTLNAMNGICFSYSNSLNTFLLSYYTFDDCVTPYLYEHRFKVIDNLVFEQSLDTNIYTIASPDFFDTIHAKSIDELEEYFNS